MKKNTIFYKLLILLIYHLAVPVFGQETSGEQILVPLSAPGEPGTLAIDHIKGSISVTGYEGEVVIVNASARRKGAAGQNTIQGSGLKRIAANLIQLRAQEKDNKVIVETNSHKNSIDLVCK